VFAFCGIKQIATTAIRSR